MNSYSSKDVYAIMNEVVAQSMGSKDLATVDATNFTTVGETVLRTGTEKVLDTISTILVNTIFDIKKYTRKLAFIEASNLAWSAGYRKLKPLYKQLEQYSADNTDLDQPITDGESVDMYKINKPKMVQVNFIGRKVIEKSITQITASQVNNAFKSEAEFMSFLDFIMTAFANELEKTFEEENRLTLANFIAAKKAVNNNVVDLVAEYNTTFDTTFTRDELLTTYHESFVKFVFARLTIDREYLTEFTTKYHVNFEDYAPIAEHTPKADQRFVMYAPFLIDAKADVLTGLFNLSELGMEESQYEKINYWQSLNSPSAIKIKANYLDPATGSSADSEEVAIDYVLGVLYDKGAMGRINIFSQTATTPLNAKGLYYNTFYHGVSMPWNDLTSNAIVYVLGAGGATA